MAAAARQTQQGICLRRPKSCLLHAALSEVWHLGPAGPSAQCDGCSSVPSLRGLPKGTFHHHLFCACRLRCCSATGHFVSPLNRALIPAALVFRVPSQLQNLFNDSIFTARVNSRSTGPHFAESDATCNYRPVAPAGDLSLGHPLTLSPIKAAAGDQH